MARDRAEIIDLYKHFNDSLKEIGSLYQKTVILVNGGAAISVLGFVASVMKNDQTYTALLNGVADALMLFAWGVVAGLAAIALTYLTNYFIMVGMNAEGMRYYPLAVLTKRLIHIITLAASISSLVLFALGATAVRHAIIIGLA